MKGKKSEKTETEKESERRAEVSQHQVIIFMRIKPE